MQVKPTRRPYARQSSDVAYLHHCPSALLLFFHKPPARDISFIPASLDRMPPTTTAPPPVALSHQAPVPSWHPRSLVALALFRGALAQPLLERPSLAHRQLDHRRRRYCVEQPVRLAIALAHQRVVSEQQQAGRRRRTRDVLAQRVGAFDSEGLTVADDNEPGAHAERQRERRTYDRLGGRLTGVEDLAAQRGEPRVREEDPCHGGESVVERLPVRPVNERQRRHLSRLDLARER